MKNITLVIITLVATAACSSSVDSVPNPLDNIPVIETEGAKPEDKNLIEPQSIGDTVPELDDDIAYYGVHPLVMSEAMQMNLNGESTDKAFDLELIADKDTRFYIDRFWVEATGECAGHGNEWFWMEVTKSGQVNAFDTVKPFDILTVKEGTRYLLRVAYTGTAGCEKMSTYITFSETL